MYIYVFYHTFVQNQRQWNQVKTRTQIKIMFSLCPTKYLQLTSMNDVDSTKSISLLHFIKLMLCCVFTVFAWVKIKISFNSREQYAWSFLTDRGRGGAIACRLNVMNGLCFYSFLGSSQKSSNMSSNILSTYAHRYTVYVGKQGSDKIILFSSQMEKLCATLWYAEREF